MVEWPKVVGWGLSVLISLMLILSAVIKLVAGAWVAEQLKVPGISPWITVIGLGELASAILYLIPLTSPLGTLLLSSYMGGAIIVHMTKQGTDPQESFVFQSVFLVLIWVAGYLRGTWGWGQRAG
jgi:hypothetical protein